MLLQYQNSAKKLEFTNWAIGNSASGSKGKRDRCKQEFVHLCIFGPELDRNESPTCSRVFLFFFEVRGAQLLSISESAWCAH